MVASSKKTNDEWGIKGYEFVKYNALYRDKPTVYSITKPPDKDKPRDYISMLQKQKKLIPGPIYEVGLNISKPGKFFIPKEKGKTYFEAVVNNAKKTPGVGKYDVTGPKIKVHGNYTTKQEGGGFSDEAKAIGMSSPSHYPAIDMDKMRSRTLATKIYKPKGGPGDNRIVKENSPNPHTYRKEDAFDKTQSTNIKYGIPKGPKKSFTDAVVKQAAKVPGIGKYDITKADKVITLGARKGYR